MALNETPFAQLIVLSTDERMCVPYHNALQSAQRKCALVVARIADRVITLTKSPRRLIMLNGAILSTTFEE
jgi:hypothetical protein